MAGGRHGNGGPVFEIFTNRMCRAYLACVLDVACPALTGWAIVCRGSGAAERGATDENFNYSKWIRTISGTEQTRRGGPQVPAPLEV
jgi:hypothetical protein